MKGKVLLIVFFASLLSACSKYEDGPLLSLRSKEERVANVWKVENAVDLNGKDSTATFSLNKWELTDQFSVIYHIGQTKYFGRWQFTQSNENLEMTFDSLPTETYVIKMLKEDEMILRNRVSDVTITFIPID